MTSHTLRQMCFICNRLQKEVHDLAIYKPRNGEKNLNKNNDAMLLKLPNWKKNVHTYLSLRVILQ